MVGDLAPQERFTDRVADYVRSRPSYPPQVIACLVEECGLKPTWSIADVGAGTGLLSTLFLQHGNTVHAIEPNAAMRAAAVAALGENPRFIPVAGSAEATTLPAQSVELVVAGQAFHWFDPHEARGEFQRILKPGGFVALVWNMRRKGEPFSDAYEALLQRFGTDYQRVCAERIDLDMIKTFFASPVDQPLNLHVRRFKNSQTLDWQGLHGRLLSSSYVPKEDNPCFELMITELKDIFQRFQHQGTIDFPYETVMYYGRLD